MVLISFAVTAKLICIFVFAYAKCWFSDDTAHIFIEPSHYVNYVSDYQPGMTVASLLSLTEKLDAYNSVNKPRIIQAAT